MLAYFSIKNNNNNKTKKIIKKKPYNYFYLYIFL